jgi:Uncharacterized protein related to plant photosystem II stability/assembly factor
MGFMNEKHGITIGANGECHYTDDGGKTWQRANNQSACRYGMDNLDDSIIWSCGNYGNIRFTKDGGKNWDKLADNGFSANLISFRDLQNGWIGSPSANKLVATTDGGMHWNPFDTLSLINLISGIAQLSATSGYVLVQEPDASVLYLTEDGGKTWRTGNVFSKICMPFLTRTAKL